MEFSDQKRREQYNKEINVLPSYLQDYTFTSSRIVVRLFQYDSMNVSKSGVIKPKQLEKYSSNGQIASKLDDVKYKPMGIVIAIPKPAQAYMEENFAPEEIPTVGQVVAIDSSQMEPGSIMRNILQVDRSVAIPQLHGFYKIHPSHLDWIENHKYQLKYEEEKNS